MCDPFINLCWVSRIKEIKKTEFETILNLSFYVIFLVGAINSKVEDRYCYFITLCETKIRATLFFKSFIFKLRVEKCTNRENREFNKKFF